MERKARIDTRGTYRNHGPLFPDTRKGLGYGLSIPSGKHNPRAAQDNFPYLDPDFYDDEIDDEIYDEELGEIESAFLTKMNKNVFATDSMDAASTDPFYFVAGNTKLSEAPAAAKNSIVAIPGLYKGGFDGSAVGGFSTDAAFTPGSYKRTGSKQGYFSPPPLPDVPQGYELTSFRLKDMLEDDELAMVKMKALKDYINSITSKHVDKGD